MERETGEKEGGLNCSMRCVLEFFLLEGRRTSQDAETSIDFWGATLSLVLGIFIIGPVIATSNFWKFDTCWKKNKLILYGLKCVRTIFVHGYINLLSMLPGYFIYPAEQVPGAYQVWVRYGYVPGTPRGVLNYFNRFDRPIRSSVRLGAGSDTAGCGSGTAICSQIQKIQKIKCMSEI
jgi:hypothetical protein